jgi:hypothetical protein
MHANTAIEILPDESHLAEAAADRFIGIVEATLRYRQVADVVVAGGSTARRSPGIASASFSATSAAWGRTTPNRTTA